MSMTGETQDRDDEPGVPQPIDELPGPQPPRRDKRMYFVLMGICIGLFVLSWAVVDRYSTTAAVILTIIALVIPPFAAIVANAFSVADRRRR
jgi:lipopolysaccharide export LptBFGC system permease protein LptF